MAEAVQTPQALTDEQLLTVAMNIEAQVIHVPTGVQDYRPALYGGVSAVELSVTGVRRVALSVPLRELEQRIVLAYTGASRNSGINNWDVMSRRIGNDPVVVGAFEGIRDAALGLRASLEAADWAGVARHLTCEWEHRKHLGPTVTTDRIDDLFAKARAAGALAGKVCGAGGGGCLFCLVSPEDRPRVADALASAGATDLPFTIESSGLQVVVS